MSEAHGAADESTPLFCHRCGRTLKPGQADFYVVRIDAVADPTPPVIEDEEEVGDVAAAIAELMDQMRRMSEQELLDQVHRRLVLHLCGPCYRQWIEDPVGSSEPGG
jgi:hypothetical protein